MKKQNEKEQKLLNNLVKNFFKVTNSKKVVEMAFNQEKIEFESAMDVLYEKYSSDDGNIYVDKDIDTTDEKKRIKVHKVQPTNVNWDVEKLKEVLGEEYSSDVMINSYTVCDWNLLINLAKEYKIPWKKFKRCIEISKVVKTDRLDKLIELGKVDGEEVKKCSDVRFNKPYYKLTEV